MLRTSKNKASDSSSCRPLSLRPWSSTFQIPHRTFPRVLPLGLDLSYLILSSTRHSEPLRIFDAAGSRSRLHTILVVGHATRLVLHKLMTLMLLSCFKTWRFWSHFFSIWVCSIFSNSSLSNSVHSAHNSFRAHSSCARYFTDFVTFVGLGFSLIFQNFTCRFSWNFWCVSERCWCVYGVN